MSYDLNIPWPVNNYDKSPTLQQLTNLRNIIITNYSLGITHQAINFQISIESVKIPTTTTATTKINPIPINQLLNELLPKFPKLKLFSRLTLIVNDSSKLPQLNKLQNQFDIIAIQPLNEKVLQLSILNLDIDLISINLASKLSFYLKFKTLNNATEKGIKFEICYSQLISGNTNSGGGGYIDDSTNTNLIKKNFFNNVLQLIRGCRSRGIIISSGAQTSLQLRNLSDILILLKTLSSSPSDLSKNNCSKFITINPERVLINGKLKQKSHRQTIVVNNDGDLLQEKQTISGSGGGFKKKLDDTSSGRLLKRRKTTK